MKRCAGLVLLVVLAMAPTFANAEVRYSGPDAMREVKNWIFRKMSACIYAYKEPGYDASKGDPITKKLYLLAELNKYGRFVRTVEFEGDPAAAEHYAREIKRCGPYQVVLRLVPVDERSFLLPVDFEYRVLTH